MVTLAPRTQALLIVGMLLLMIIFMVVAGWRRSRAKKLLRLGTQSMEEALLIEYLARLRHRNISGLRKVLNEARQRKGFSPLDERTLLKVQYDVKVSTADLLDYA